MLEMIADPADADRVRGVVAALAPLFRAQPGCLALRLDRVEGDEGRHLLLIEWADIADHRDGFAKSDAFRTWAAAIGPLLRGAPRLTYHRAVLAA